MQQYLFFAALRRYWIILVALPLVVGGTSVVVERMQPPRYRAVARVLVTQEPVPHGRTAAFPDVNLSYSWESSEFILDDMPQVISSFLFAQDISTWLAVQGYEVDPAAIQNSLDAETFHRTVTLSSQAANPELAVTLLEGTIEKLKSNGLKYWNRATVDSNGLSVAVLDPPAPAGRVHDTRWLVMNVGLRAGLALAAAIALVAVLFSLDTTLREPHQVEVWTGLSVIGAIPEEKS